MASVVGAGVGMVPESADGYELRMGYNLYGCRNNLSHDVYFCNYNTVFVCLQTYNMDYICKQYKCKHKSSVTLLNCCLIYCIIYNSQL